MVVQGPPAAGQFGSAMHSGVQPSPKSLFFGSGSQPSVPSTTPSPHTVWWQLVALQAQPAFTVQSELQAEASAAMPGSHCSAGGIRMPSPHTGTQGAPANGHW